MGCCELGCELTVGCCELCCELTVGCCELCCEFTVAVANYVLLLRINRGMLQINRGLLRIMLGISRGLLQINLCTLLLGISLACPSFTLQPAGFGVRVPLRGCVGVCMVSQTKPGATRMSG